MKDLEVDDSWIQREIKSEPITKAELEKMHKMQGSYEVLFSRRAMKYRELSLNKKELSEEDYKSYILDEYTFLKRPVIILDNDIFVGNSKAVIEAVGKKLRQ